MILSVEQAKQLNDFTGWTDAKIERKLKAVEQTIRAYTNNNFQNRGIRVSADIENGVFKSDFPCEFIVGDTVQVSESRLNRGLYVVTEAEDHSFKVAEAVRDEMNVLCTRIEYPADVVECCIKLLEWDHDFAGKVGIKSETLSRHSVTYEDSGTLFMGYPVGILKGLKLYNKARF